jgi:hypothetical protein
MSLLLDFVDWGFKTSTKPHKLQRTKVKDLSGFLDVLLPLAWIKMNLSWSIHRALGGQKITQCSGHFPKTFSLHILFKVCVELNITKQLLALCFKISHLPLEYIWPTKNPAKIKTERILFNYCTYGICKPFTNVYIEKSGFLGVCFIKILNIKKTLSFVLIQSIPISICQTSLLSDLF